MPFRESKRLITAKIESTYGTDSGPTGAEALIVKNLNRTIYDGPRVSRDIIRPFMGNDHSINAGPFVTLNFDVELAGASAAGVAPAFGPLLRACGMSETTVLSTSVTYAFVSDNFESVTIHYNYDGEVQKVAGARGTFTINMNRQQIPVISFTFTGLYARPVAEALPSPTFTQLKPRPVNDTNTTTFSVFSQSVFGESFTLDAGNNVVHRNLINDTRVLISDRAPTGSALFEALAVSTKDFFASVESHNTVTEGAIQIVHGAGAGNVCTIDINQCQLSNIDEQASDGIRMHNISYIPVPTNSGNDEVSIAFT